MNRINPLFSLTSPSLLLMLAVALAVPGCKGESGPPRYDLSGTVTYDGKPVPAGEVSLEPDGSRGNSGPACIAVIENGQYKTEPKMGIVGGPYIARIAGFDGVPVGDMTVGTSLFPTYQTEVEFPQQTTTHNFEIPASTGP